MFKKIFEYAGPYKKNMYVATVRCPALAAVE